MCVWECKYLIIQMAAMNWLSKLLRIKRQKNSDLQIEYCVSCGISDSIKIHHNYTDPPFTLLFNKQTNIELSDEVVEWPVTHILITECSVPSLPESMSLFTSLTHLIVLQSGLVKLPSCLPCLVNLQVIDVTDNKLVEIPQSIAELTNLQKLIVMYNCLKEIPTAILYLPLLEQVEVFGNTKLVWPPIEICLLGIAEIKSFMHESLDRQMCRQNELKGAKPYGSSLFGSSKREIFTLREIITSYIIEHEMEFARDPSVPPLMRKQLTVVHELSQFHTPISKCSMCGMYFSSEPMFKLHDL